jgi:hypothetical protein
MAVAPELGSLLLARRLAASVVLAMPYDSGTCTPMLRLRLGRLSCVRSCTNPDGDLHFVDHEQVHRYGAGRGRHQFRNRVALATSS